MRIADDSEFGAEREAMIEIISAYVYFSSEHTHRQRLGERVMAAMGRVPRHHYVPRELRHIAYEDSPLPIGHGKTISQPFMVALMTDLLDIEPDDRVLEVGTGLGYQAAILAELAKQVYTIEILEELANTARERLDEAGYERIHFRVGNGANGWPEHAPFDKIIVTAAPELIPPALLQQLTFGGRMVIPAGIDDDQMLLLVEKGDDGHLHTREVIPVRFAPLIVSH